MFEQKTKTIELGRGYVAPDGNAHRHVTLRVPMIEDEIRADAKLAELRASANEVERSVAGSGALHALAMAHECIVAWDGIADVQLAHLRQLTRADAGLIISAFHTLEAEDAEDAKRLLSGNSETGERATE